MCKMGTDTTRGTTEFTQNNRKYSKVVCFNAKQIVQVTSPRTSEGTVLD